LAAVVVAIIIVAGLFVYVFSSTGVSTSTSPLVTSSPTASSSTTAVLTSFAFKNVTLQTPQTQPPCKGLLCQSNSELSGIVFVDASSPLSCLDVSLNGTSVGSDCWNLTSPSFTMAQCDGSGNSTSCTTIVTQNTYTETNRTFALGYPIQSGGNSPAVVAGRTYLIALVAQFENGSNVTASATVVASVSTASSGSGASCSGNPQGGGSNAAGGTYSYTFPLTLNYSGPWTLTYQGYDSMGESNPTSTSGNCSGTGIFGISVTVSGPTSDALTLCAQAQKLDSSNATMTLTITGHNETSLPNGSVSYCGGVVP
jgi:hypothetical protein